ncbi:helix-turn-helix transcriptional regulator [Halomonas sp. QX-2]|uniref:Helix-turn-helix transcriptional regulator n=1 Tax=Vreelandella sedimenti TaxID=2729618 RepID=A0A7Z0SLG8_9GAMM|nr:MULTISPECIES: helix-turn-helix transcriptional regulator [Halomonas]NYT72472.1 helix-turn-helix transcriptional regulator [Halomonas sedimenti]|tara:strand:- start:4568 stop:4918 length:351 start_codon:yes stop_codon:yes gene_type:complete
MFNFPFPQDKPQQAPQAFSQTRRSTPAALPWASNAMAEDDADKRLTAMERDEPKRRLIRDAKALYKMRKITQAQMAEEVGVPCRTLEEWLQFRRMPKAPGTTLLRRWLEAYQNKIS